MYKFFTHIEKKNKKEKEKEKLETCKRILNSHIILEKLEQIPEFFVRNILTHSDFVIYVKREKIENIKNNER